jgi:hypothetical protein
MQISHRFSTLAFSCVFAFASSAPLATFAGNGPAKPAASPKPDEQKKIWTNDDVQRLNPDFIEVSGKRNVVESASSSTVVVTPMGLRRAPVVVAVAVPIADQQNPAWYGQQVTELQAELSTVESHEEQLRNFRKTAGGLPTGLTLNAPTGGITTDNLIANLDAQRRQILAQLDALDDLARSNGLPPGILVEGRGLVQPGAQPGAAEQRIAAESLAQAAAERLADVQLTVVSMQDQAASLNATLQSPTPGFGGNPTTDLLERLNGQANALQGVIENADEAARSLGVPPGDLR